MPKHPILKSYVVKHFKKLTVSMYGAEEGKAIYCEYETLCLQYAGEYSNISKQEEQHYFEQILPFIAVYKIMQKKDVQRAEEVLQTIVEKRSEQASSILQVLLKVPGLYKNVPQICNKLIAKSFSEEAGFQYGKTECGKAEWKADIVQCPYFNTCKKYECVEIAHYFCDSDDMIYGNLHKKVLWKRTKTLGRGDEVCDFNVEIKQ